ncbi:hypothetical protein Anas_03656, partial [Armadillidium nasatum]
MITRVFDIIFYYFWLKCYIIIVKICNLKLVLNGFISCNILSKKRKIGIRIKANFSFLISFAFSLFMKR